MSITIREYTDEQVPAVRRFNERISAGGTQSQFPLSPVPEWLPKAAGRRLFQEYYLAVEGEGAAVRGAYVLKHQDFWIRDRAVAIGDFDLPISEGIVDRAYCRIGVQLLRDAMRRQPLLYALGIGGYEEPLTRLLIAAGWSTFCVPFFFRVVHPAAFLRNVARLRGRAVSRWTSDALAATGLGWLAIRSLQAILGPQRRPDPVLRIEQVDEFSDWADDVWQHSRNQYGMTAVRDAETLRILYPRSDGKFLRLKISEGAGAIGWVVLLDTQCSGHKYFGDMRLGSIVNNFAAPADAARVLAAAAAFLQARGVDLMVSNQSHAAWCDGMRQAGFLGGPSNVIFAASPELAALLRRENTQNHELHFNRGDGDGPINL